MADLIEWKWKCAHTDMRGDDSGQCPICSERNHPLIEELIKFIVRTCDGSSLDEGQRIADRINDEFYAAHIRLTETLAAYERSFTENNTARQRLFAELVKAQEVIEKIQTRIAFHRAETGNRAAKGQHEWAANHGMLLRELLALLPAEKTEGT